MPAFIPFCVYLLLLAVGCGSDSANAPGGGRDAGSNDGDGSDAGVDDNDADKDASIDTALPGQSDDPLGPSPRLDVPGVAPELAEAVLGSKTFEASYNATLDVLAEGGITTGFGDVVKREAKEPAASAFVFPVSAIDLALEAADRATMATFTLSELAQLLDEVGWPTPEGMAPQDHWVELLAAWYAAAAADVDAPDSFAVLFIAAMNQAQSPSANIATGHEDPSLIRLSLLEIELLVAAFDRAVPMPVAATKTALVSSALGTPCSDFVKQAGALGQVGQVGAGELAGAGIGAALEQTFGTVTGGNLSSGLAAVGTLAKIGKLIQHLRYGYAKLDLTTLTPVKKPLRDAPYKQGTLLATAGVDPAKYAAKVAEAGGAENSAQRQAIADCFNSLNLPTTTDARDIAADADNWRVSWSIVAGGGTQVLWPAGTSWDILSRYENKVTRLNDSTVTNMVAFDILPQSTKATVGRERARKAVFKVQLRRGGLPDLSTLWGSGKAGAAAALANPIGAALGLADAVTEISTKWALEGASPSAYARQDLIEIEPTGLVGTIKWTIHGSASSDEGDELSHEIETATINQSGLIEIISEKDEEATVFGSETCVQSYGYGLEQLDIVEGSEVVGMRTDRTARQYNESWQTPTREPRESIATVIDGSTMYEGIDLSLLPPELRKMAGHVQIYLTAVAGCGPTSGYLSEANEDYNYDSTDGWQLESTYTHDPLSVVPVSLEASILDLERKPGSNKLVGKSELKREHTLYGLAIPIVQTIEWNLHWVE